MAKPPFHLTVKGFEVGLARGLGAGLRLAAIMLSIIPEFPLV